MRLGCLVATIALLAGPTPGWAQDSADPVQVLLEQERIRALVERAFASVAEARGRHQDDNAFVEAYTDIAYELGRADPAVIPLLANEMLQSDPSTFYLTTYALAFHATPEAIEALYAAVARADDEQTSYAEARKTHLIWALAAAGESRAVLLADQGRHEVGDLTVHRQFSVLEAATIMTAPESLEILHRELSVDDLPPAEESQRTLYSIRAIGRVGDPSSLPILLALLKSESDLIRIEVAKALAFYPQTEAIDALLAALHDRQGSVSAYAAYSLVTLLPKDRFDQIAEQIDTVKSPIARRALYRYLVRTDLEAAVPILMRRTSVVQDPAERRGIYQAAGLTRSAVIVDLLIHGMADPDLGVGVMVIQALARIEDPRARRVLLRAIDSPRWPVAQSAAKLAADLGLEGAASSIRARLLNVELPRLTRNSAEKPAAEWLLDLTLELLDVKALRGLEKALTVHRDGLLIEKIERAVKQLKAAKNAGDDLKEWETLAYDPDIKIRETAYRYLGRVHPPKAAAEILASVFGRVEAVESPLVLEHLANLDTPKTREIVERVLTASEYQHPELYRLRDTAAWAARRLGGEQMIAALRRSIEMRQGRDIRPIIYYAVMTGKEAIPVISDCIASRMRFSAITRGKEHDYLRELLTTLHLNQDLDASDVAPSKLNFM